MPFGTKKSTSKINSVIDTSSFCGWLDCPAKAISIFPKDVTSSGSMYEMKILWRACWSIIQRIYFYKTWQMKSSVLLISTLTWGHPSIYLNRAKIFEIAISTSCFEGSFSSFTNPLLKQNCEYPMARPWPWPRSQQSSSCSRDLFCNSVIALIICLITRSKSPWSWKNSDTLIFSTQDRVESQSLRWL